MEAVAQGVEVDQHGDLGHPLVEAAGAGDQTRPRRRLGGGRSRRRRLLAGAFGGTTAASRAAETWASVSGSSSRWVWHIPVTRSTHRRTRRSLLATGPAVTVPSSRDRIRSRLAHLPFERPRPGIVVADPTIADSAGRVSSARPASSRRAASAGDGVDVAGGHAPRRPRRRGPAAGRRTPHRGGRPLRRRVSSGAHRPASNVDAGSQEPWSARREACSAMRASKASSQLRTRCEAVTRSARAARRRRWSTR